MSQPIRVLAWMLGVLAAVAVLAVMMRGPLSQAFAATAGFNALILAVFGVGIVVNLQQCCAQGEVR